LVNDLRVIKKRRVALIKGPVVHWELKTKMGAGAYGPGEKDNTVGTRG